MIEGKKELDTERIRRMKEARTSKPFSYTQANRYWKELQEIEDWYKDGLTALKMQALVDKEVAREQRLAEAEEARRIIQEEGKICPRCKEHKPPSEFYRRKDGSIHHYCKKCNSEYSAQWQRDNPRDKDKVLDAHRKRTYGVVDGQVESIRKKQGKRCAICRRRETDSETFHLDHNHETGAVRGLLCRSCNSGIGFLNDSIELLYAAIDYLEEYQNKI